MAAALRKTEDGFELTTKAVALIVSLVGLLSVVASMAIAYATTTNTIARKVDREEYTAEVARITARLATDSMRADYDRRGLADIKASTDEISRRLTQFICARSHEDYCR